MIKIVAAFVGVVGVFWLAIAGGYAIYWYDRRPSGVPAPIVAHALWFHPAFGLPLSLQAQRDAAAAQLADAQANVRVLQRAISDQNAAIAANAARGVDALAQAEQAVQQARSVSATRIAMLHALSAPIAGADDCARVRAVDRTFLGVLR